MYFIFVHLTSKSLPFRQAQSYILYRTNPSHNALLLNVHCLGSLQSLSHHLIHAVVSCNILASPPPPSQIMMNEIVEIYSDMVHLSFFPDHWSRIPEEQQELLQDWQPFPGAMETARPWLTTCVREIRCCACALIEF